MADFLGELPTLGFGLSGVITVISMTPNELKQGLRGPGSKGRDFDETLKIEVRIRQQGKCWLCSRGKPIEAIAHVNHRGMGGDKRMNDLRNVIGVDNDCHDRLDHRRKPWLRIVRFDPADVENGLEVEMQVEDTLFGKAWMPVPRGSLGFYFYQAGAVNG